MNIFKSLFRKKIKDHFKINGFLITGDKLHLGGINNTKGLNNGFKIIKKYLPEKPVVIDVGAYIGSYSLKYSAIPDSTIYSIEPLKSNFELLLKNVQYNKISNIKCFQIGVSDTNGKAFFGNPTREQGWRYRFEDAEDKAFNSIYANKVMNESNVINGEECEIVTLDDFIDKNDIKKVDFIKIDAEGHDLNVLKGANKTILKHKPILQVEAIDYILQLAGLTVDDLINYIKTLDLYDIYYFTKNSRSIKKVEGKNYPRGMNLLLIPKK